MHKCVFVRQDGTALTVDGTCNGFFDLDGALHDGATILQNWPLSNGVLMILKIK